MGMAFLIGCIVGILLNVLIFFVVSTGVLRVDHSDPDGPFLFLELKKDVNYVASKKYIVLKVKSENFISHK